MERFEKDLKEKFLKREIAPSEETRSRFEMLLDNTDKKHRFANSKKIAMAAASVFLLGGLLMYWFSTVVKDQMAEPNKTEQQLVKHSDTKVEEKKNLVAEKSQESSHKNNKKSFIKTTPATVSEIIEKEPTEQEEIPQLVQSVQEITTQEAVFHSQQEEIISQRIKVSPQKLLNVIEYEKQIEYLAANSKSMQQIFRELRVKMVNINIEKKNSDAKK